jgi:hypothetical protein
MVLAFFLCCANMSYCVPLVLCTRLNLLLTLPRECRSALWSLKAGAPATTGECVRGGVGVTVILVRFCGCGDGRGGVYAVCCVMHWCCV